MLRLRIKRTVKIIEGGIDRMEGMFDGVLPALVVFGGSTFAAGLTIGYGIGVGSIPVFALWVGAAIVGMLAIGFIVGQALR